MSTMIRPAIAVRASAVALVGFPGGRMVLAAGADAEPTTGSVETPEATPGGGAFRIFLALAAKRL